MMRSLNFKKYNIGWFTLIEILLVIVAIAIMMVVGLTAVRWLLSTVKFKSSREIFVTDYNYVLVKSFSTSLTDARISIMTPDQSHQSVLRFELTPDPSNIKQLFSFAPTPGLIIKDGWILRFKENLGCERSNDWGTNRTSTSNPIFKISYLSETSNLTKFYKINLTTCKIWITQPSSS